MTKAIIVSGTEKDIDTIIELLRHAQYLNNEGLNKQILVDVSFESKFYITNAPHELNRIHLRDFEEVTDDGDIARTYTLGE